MEERQKNKKNKRKNKTKKEEEGEESHVWVLDEAFGKMWRLKAGWKTLRLDLILNQDF